MVLVLFLLAASANAAEHVVLPGLEKPVEILRDRWGVPHIYAQNTQDLFFAQGYITARDRLFQMDLWRRAGTGKLAEVLGPAAVERDRLARAVRYRGNWDAEWQSYSPDTKQITTSFVNGINAYIQSRKGVRTLEFRTAGYDPGLWTPEDCASRIAGLTMGHNLTKEVSRALEAAHFGIPTLQKYLPPDPPVPLVVPRGLDLSDIDAEIVRTYEETVGSVTLAEKQGSNNWVIDGTRTLTGKPILANDPHRPVRIPSLRKTVHLVAPGWNVFGAGEPALPGIALGHNEFIAFGFTIVGTDQQDLYVEKLNPSNPNEYRYRGGWRKFEIERQQVNVKGQPAKTIELRYSIHGPIISENRSKNRAYALKWVGSEPGTAGYLGALALCRAKNWDEFQQGTARYKMPAENLVYADVAGNIGWQVTGMCPLRKNWTGLFPVPGDSGEYEWSGFLDPRELPHSLNPPSHLLATANHNILPQGYTTPLSYEWAQPFRIERIRQLLGEPRKFGVADFERIQQDIISLPARRFQSLVRQWRPSATPRQAALADRLLNWDAALKSDSVPAMIFEMWIRKLRLEVYGEELGPRVTTLVLLKTLETAPNPKAMARSLDLSLAEFEQAWGRDMNHWTWGRIHQIEFRHPLNVAKMNRGPMPRPGDGETVNSTNGLGFVQTDGASYRQIIDLADWDRAVMTNTPGESGDPDSPHYSDLLEDWAAGRYHPMPFSRKAVEAATMERILLSPK